MAADLSADFDRLATCGAPLAVKLYRVTLGEHEPAIPVLPCLDHEAMLHQHVAPHLSAYLLGSTGTSLHEVGIYPSQSRLVLDTASTAGEFSTEAHDALMHQLRTTFPRYRVIVHRPSLWRGERRVADACRAQISLREVLTAEPSDRLKRQIERLQVVGALMEKQSRVASWGVRTATGPLVAAAGAILYAVLGVAGARIGILSAAEWQYAIIAALGTTFLYFGLKAVQLTDMANQVWKRATEYSLILAERRRLGR